MARTRLHSLKPAKPVNIGRGRNSTKRKKLRKPEIAGSRAGITSEWDDPFATYEDGSLYPASRYQRGYET